MRRPLLIAGVLSASFASSAFNPCLSARAEKPRAADAVASLLDAIFAPRPHSHGPSCGCALPASPPAEPTCEATPLCLVEPTCGAEPDCGIEPSRGLETLGHGDLLHHDAFAPSPRLQHAPVRMRLQSHPPTMIDRSFAPAPRLPQAPTLLKTDGSSRAASEPAEASKAMPGESDDSAHPPEPIVEPMPARPAPKPVDAIPVEATPMPAAPMPKTPPRRPKPTRPAASPAPAVESIEPAPQPMPVPQAKPMPQPIPEPAAESNPEPIPMPMAATEEEGPAPTAEPLTAPSPAKPAPAPAKMPSPKPLAPEPEPLPNFDHTDPFADPPAASSASPRTSTPALTPLPRAVQPQIDPETIEIPRFGEDDFSPVGTGVRPTSGVMFRGTAVRPALRIVPLDAPSRPRSAN